MSLSDQQIKSYQINRQLVSFRRDDIDDSELQGFILNWSERLLLLHHVRDFLLDGYLLLDREHITNARCHATNQFQVKLLESEGTLAKVDFDQEFTIDSWEQFLGSRPTDSIVIIEQEMTEPPFVHYGKFIDIDEDGFVRLHEFTGAANWEMELTLIPLEDITCIQAESSYLLPYQRYFKANPTRPEV